MPLNLQGIRRVFERSHRRSESLLELHRLLHGKQGRPSRIVSDVVRSALLLSSASLDALVNSALSESAPEALRLGRLGDSAKSWAAKHEGIVSALADPDPPAFIRRVVQEKLANTNLQNPEAIEGNLLGVITCPPPWDRAVDLLRPTATNPDSVDTEWVKQELRDAIARRHRIAHDADINPGAATPGTATPIHRQTVETWLWVIGSVGLATVDVIEDHLVD